MNKEIEKIKPSGIFTNYIYKAIPLAFDESMSYYETLCGILSLLKTQEQVINNNADLLAELENYVKTYFDNLDVQEEINNKLDKMVEDGTLENIISTYIDNNISRTFENVNDIITNIESVYNGMKIKTLGYHEINDGGDAEYIVTNNEDENELQINIGDGLYANLIYKDIIYVKQFGCYCDNEHDDTLKLQKIMDIANNKVSYYGENCLTIDGQNQIMKITSTLKSKFQTKLQNLHINFYNGEYIQNYCILINANDSLTILQQYPRENIGYMKNCIFENVSNLNLNGIFNASNNLFSDISMKNFDIFFRTSNDYLDSWTLQRAHFTDKIVSENYGVICGMIGDECSLKDCHFNINGNAIDIGSAHNGFTIENLICHGNIIMGGSNVTINNIHTEAGKIICNGSSLKLTNGFLYHENNHIELNDGANAILENIRFIYRNDLYSYENINDIDIYTNDDISNFEVKNCFKKIMDLPGSIPLTTPALSHIKTNREVVTTGSYKKFNSVLNTKTHDTSRPNSYFSVIRRYGKWYGGTHDYYFKIISMVDITRLIANLNYNNNFNYSFTNNDSAWGSLASNFNALWRIYRGSSTNNYDAYCDIAHNNGRILDNGYMVNGNKWQTRTSGNIDNMNQITNNTIAKYDDNDNIIVHLDTLPLYGEWKADDIVILPNNTSYRCSVAGTPGTWVQI